MTKNAAEASKIEAEQKRLDYVKGLRHRLRILQEIDPILDPHWSAITTSIYKSINVKRRDYVEQRVLNPKGIFLDAASGKLKVVETRDIEYLMQNFRSEEVRGLAQSLLKIETSMRATSRASEFADLMESGISIIDKFDVQNDANLASEHATLRRSFIADIAKLTRESELEVDDNARDIGWKVVQIYILQVYLRHQISRFVFRAKPASALNTHENEFVRRVIAPQAQLRRCLIRTSEDLVFVIGAPSNSRQNPFSIRRFLHEDHVHATNSIYLNATVIDKTLLGDPAYQKHSQTSMTRIVTLEQNWGQNTMAVVSEMEAAYEKEVAPKLMESVMSADGSDLEIETKRLLAEVEKSLTFLILSRFTTAVNDPQSNDDDLELLQLTLRNIMLNLSTDIACFNLLPVAAFSKRTETFELRVVGYLTLLTKRAGRIGALKQSEDNDQSAHEKVLDSLTSLLKALEPKLEKLETEQKQLAAKLENPPGAFKQWLIRTFKLEDTQAALDKINRETSKTKHKCLIEIIRLFKRFSDVSLYLELEGILLFNDYKRHYTLATGRSGVARLPKLFSLYENRNSLQVKPLMYALNFDPLQEETWDSAYDDTKHTSSEH